MKENKIFIILFLIIFLFSLYYYDFSRPPVEDAAMLLRYSKNLGDGYGIVWNHDEEHVDGATDFLFMIFLSLLYKLGIDLILADNLIGIIFHFLTLIIIFIILKKDYKINSYIVGIVLIFFSLGPGLRYVELHFGTPFFAFFASLTWFFANKIILNKSNKSLPIYFSISGLFLGLARPEGVILAFLMLISIIYFKGLKNSKKEITSFIFIFTILGGLYFIWRWIYFGYPLPNPFYKKGGRIYLNSLIYSMINIIKFSFPFILVYIVGLFTLKKRKYIYFSLIPIFGFCFIWILLSNEMNFIGRFQYALFPIIIISGTVILNDILIQKKGNVSKFYNKKLKILIFLFIIFNLIFYQLILFPSKEIEKDNLYEVGIFLNKFEDKGYKLATSEAGLIPYYSNWNSIDTWGLNDKNISHSGGISLSYLKEKNPDLIIFNAPFSPFKENPAKKIKWYQNKILILNWYNMTRVLKEYIEENNYTLSVSITDKNENSGLFYYIKNNLEDKDEINEKLRFIANKTSSHRKIKY